MGYVNGIFTKYYYEDYITLPLILSIFNDLAYNMYIYIFRFLIQGRSLNFLLLFQGDHAAGDYIYRCWSPCWCTGSFLEITRRLEELEKRRDTNIV